MNESDLRRLIRQEIAVAIQTITSGQAGNTTMSTEDIQTIFPGMPTIPARPIMRPYGFASRAPKGTISVTAQQGNHPGNKLTLGHRDADMPPVEEGEAAVYSIAGYIVKAGLNKVEIGKDGVYEVMVAGTTLVTFLKALMDELIQHTHIGNLGYDTSPPKNAPQLTQLKADNLDNNKILIEDGGRF